jgi:hypothetical protein
MAASRTPGHFILDFWMAKFAGSQMGQLVEIPIFSPIGEWCFLNSVWLGNLFIFLFTSPTAPCCFPKYTVFSQGGNRIFMVVRVAHFSTTTMPFPASENAVVW